MPDYTAERFDPDRRVVETVVTRWDDAAGREETTVTASRPTTDEETAYADRGRYGDAMREHGDRAAAQLLSALALLRRLERTARAGRELLAVHGPGGKEPGTLRTVGDEVARASEAAQETLEQAAVSRVNYRVNKVRYEDADRRYEAARNVGSAGGGRR